MKPIEPRLLERSAPVRRLLLLGAFLGTVTAILIVAQAWLIATVIARGFAGEGVRAATIRTVGALAVVFVLRALNSWLQQIAATRAAVRVKSQLRTELADSVLHPRRSSMLPDTSRVVTLFGSGLDALDAYFAKYLPQLILAVTVPAVVLTAVLWADPLSALTIAVTLPLIVVFMVLVGWLTKEKTERRWGALQTLSHHFLDVLDGLVVLKVFGRSQVTGLERIGRQHRRESMAALRLAFLSSFVLDLFAMLAVALVAVSVGLRLVEGHLGLKVAMFVLLLTPEAFAPLRQVGAHFHDSAEGAAAAADAFDILDGASVHGGFRPALSPATHAITIEGLEVHHPGRTRAALARTSAQVEPGEFTVLSGASGSGKSTLLGVLLGFVTPTGGRIRIGGVDLAEVDIEQWRRHIAWVPQTPGLIDGTIADNVRLGLLEASDADVCAALSDAGAAGLSIDRMIAEGGRDVSAGERRRIGVARALLRVRRAGASLLLLDEPTAGLDAATEDVIIDGLRAAAVTVVVVTHRSAVRIRADREITLSDVVPV